MSAKLAVIRAAMFASALVAGGALLFFASAYPASAAAPVKGDIYLTFDLDMTPKMLREEKGPAPKAWYDPALIDYLIKTKTPATFFVTGLFAEDHPDVVRKIAGSSLFSIGNHTYDHRGFTASCYGLGTYANDRAKEAAISRAQAILAALAGTAPKYFRYPGLCHSPADDRLVEGMGLELTGRDVASGDAFATDAAAVASEAVRHAAPGVAIVFHAGGYNAPSSLAALKIAIPKLLKKGYRLEKL